jgi:DNA-binding NarL/FixJ family response regulator
MKLENKWAGEREGGFNRHWLIDRSGVGRVFGFIRPVRSLGIPRCRNSSNGFRPMIKPPASGSLGCSASCRMGSPEHPTEPNRSVRVLIVDDDSDFLDFVRLILQQSRLPLELAGTFLSPLAALRQLVELRPDVVLVDLKMAELDGINCARRILERRPSTAVIMVSGAPTASFSCEEIIRAGARGFLNKPFHREQLEDAIYSAAHGLSVFTRLAAGALFAGQRTTRENLVRLKKLTDRETRALDLLARFLEDKEIADQLGTSIPLAKKLLHSAFRKLGVRIRSEAIVLWRGVE